MPAIVSNAKNFLLSSDYPLDKVVYLKEDTYTATIGFTSYTVAHGLPFTPLPKAVWSTTSDWSITYNISDGVPSSTPVSEIYSLQAAGVSSDATNIYVTFLNTNPSTQVYLRIWAFEPADSVADISGTASLGDSFALNTDNNYTKLYMAGVTASSSVPNSTAAVVHGLGYYPEVEVWYVRNGYTYNLTGTQTIDNVPFHDTAIVTPTTLTMWRDGFITTPEYFHYRIYLDELS